MLINDSLIDKGLDIIKTGLMVDILGCIANRYMFWELTDYDYEGPSLGEELSSYTSPKLLM